MKTSGSCTRHKLTDLVHRHHVSQPDSEVVPHHLVQADFGLLYSVVSKYNAHCIFALFALQSKAGPIEAEQNLNARQHHDGSGTLRSTVSPRKSCSVSMVLRLRATTELSSLIASSTMSRLGLFLRSKIAVLKSFLSPVFWLQQTTQTSQSTHLCRLLTVSDHTATLTLLALWLDL